MPISFEVAALNLFVALICGGLIGSERQVRQRMAGLRTNALVALGAASFVVFSQLFPDELSPTRVAAQVVSGIGFLGAGIIFRHGFTVHGLNTAATLWCAASVGILAGVGSAFLALYVTALIIFINLGLRPVVKWLKRSTRAGVPLNLECRIDLACDAEQEAEVRKAVQDIAVQNKLRITGFERGDRRDNSISFEVVVAVEDRPEKVMNAIVTALLQDTRIASAGWEALTEDF